MTDAGNETMPSIYDEPLFWGISILLLIVNVFLIVGLNCSWLILVRRVTSLRPASKVFVVSLALSDLGIGLMGLVSLLSLFHTDYRYAADSTYWMVITSIIGLFIWGNLLSLMLLITDWYLLITWCMHYPQFMTFRRSVIAVLLSSVLSIIMTAISAVTNLLKVGAKIWSYIFIAFMMLELIVIWIFYFHILVIARRQARRIAQDEQCVGGPFATARSNVKAFTVVVITVTFFFSIWCPFIIDILLVNLEVQMPELLSEIIKILFYTTYWADGILLNLRNKEFRAVFVKALSTCYNAIGKCVCRVFCPKNRNDNEQRN